jgi:ATP-dependent DNA ligase
VVQYHVYDIPHDSGFGGRADALNDFFATVENDSPLRLVSTLLAKDEEELQEIFRRYRAQGYEGAMVRNVEGAYKNSRSYDLQKVKEMDDGEFEVLDVKEGRGKLAGHAMFIMEYEGRRFDAKMKGPLEELKKFITHPQLAIGRQVTVQYQGLTTKNKVPRFPVVLRFREDV